MILYNIYKLLLFINLLLTNDNNRGILKLWYNYFIEQNKSEVIKYEFANSRAKGFKPCNGDVM